MGRRASEETARGKVESVVRGLEIPVDPAHERIETEDRPGRGGVFRAHRGRMKYDEYPREVIPLAAGSSKERVAIW